MFWIIYISLNWALIDTLQLVKKTVLQLKNQKHLSLIFISGGSFKLYISARIYKNELYHVA